MYTNSPHHATTADEIAEELRKADAAVRQPNPHAVSMAQVAPALAAMSRHKEAEPETFQAPARSSGRLAHMTLAFKVVALAMECRVSHPKLSALLEQIGNVAIAHQRADDETQAWTRTGRAEGRTPQEATDVEKAA